MYPLIYNAKIEISARKQAIANNLPFYFTGKPCKHGHIDKRFTCNNRCLTCAKLFKLKNKEKYKLTEKIYRDSNKEENRARLYGLTVEECQNLYSRQNGKCGICAKAIDYDHKDSHVDHNHKTGRVRGILCRHCNLGLGHFKDNSELLRKAALYCEEF